MNQTTILSASLLILATAVSCGSETSPLEDTTATSSASTGSTTTGGTGVGGGEGGSASASDCEEYCDQITAACTEDNAMYSNDGTCLDVCRELPAGRDGDINGNSLACRAFYLSNVAESPDTNCRYAGPGTSGKCGGSCENFCFLAQRVCTGEQSQWANQATCVQDCQDFQQNADDYVAGAIGDNFACRLYQVTLAADNPIDHCRNIGNESEACVNEGTGGGGGGPGPGPGGGGGGGLGGNGGGGVGGDGGAGPGGGSSVSSSASVTTAATTVSSSVGAGGAGGGV